MKRRTFVAAGAAPLIGLQACSKGSSDSPAPAPAPPAPSQATGWTQMPVETYNGIPQVGGNFRYDSALASIDMSDANSMGSLGFPVYLPRPLSQGTQPSCTAWAVGYAAATATLLYSQTAVPSAISPADLFAKIRDRWSPGACTQGSHISYAMDVLVQEGCLTIADAPYSAQVCGARASGRTFNIDGFSRVAAGDITSLRGALQSLQPVSFGIYVPPDFERLPRNPGIWAPNGQGGGHAMTLVGYDDSRQLFKIMNSWGSDWAAGGFCWISYSDFARYALDVCIPFARRLADNALLSATSSNSASPVVGQFIKARPYGNGTAGSYGVGVEMGWSAPLLVNAAAISVLDGSQNILFTRNFTVSQVARGLRFGGGVPDPVASYVFVRSSISGRDSGGRNVTLTTTTRPNQR